MPRLLLLWLCGLPGILALTWLWLPQVLAGQTLPLPLPALLAISTLQSALLLAVLVALGSACAARTGLGTPLLDAALAGRLRASPWRQSVVAGKIGALLGAGILLAADELRPAALAALDGLPPLPLLARLLYGGVTEELLLRLGVMSLLLWLPWRLLQRGEGRPAAGAVAFAIVGSALLFALAHLPVLAGQLPALEADVVAWALTANTAFGLLAGWLFWRHGLEAAVIAHAGAHLLAWLAGA